MPKTLNKPAKLFDNCAPFRYLVVMHQMLVDHSYPALFFLSFFAATLIPLGSERLLAVILVNHRDPLPTGCDFCNKLGLPFLEI